MTARGNACEAKTPDRDRPEARPGLTHQGCIKWRPGKRGPTKEAEDGTEGTHAQSESKVTWDIKKNPVSGTTGVCRNEGHAAWDRADVLL